jgi:hypothetical protein
MSRPGPEGGVGGGPGPAHASWTSIRRRSNKVHHDPHVLAATLETMHVREPCQRTTSKTFFCRPLA